MIDSHCHLYDDKIKDKCEDIVANFGANNIDCVIVPSCDYDSMNKAMALGTNFDKVYFSLAVHPHDAVNFDKTCDNFIIRNAGHPKCVAIGEFGFDYHYNFSPFREQIAVAERHLELCNATDLPAIFHIRDGQAKPGEHYDAFADFFDITRTCPPKRGGVLHCFGGDKDKARRALDLGYYISLTCNVTYQSNEHLRQVVEYAPIDRLLIETDSPYMSPRHARNIPNEPQNVRYVAECFAKIKKMDIERVYQITNDNTLALFYKMSKF